MGGFGLLIGLVIFLAIGYFVIKGLFTALSYVAPVLLLLAAILEYTVIIDFVRFIFKTLKEKPILGLLAIVLTIVGYPVVFGYLFLKAWTRRRMKKHAEEIEKQRNRYDAYEEVGEDEADFLILPKIEKPTEVKKQETSSEYDNLFK